MEGTMKHECNSNEGFIPCMSGVSGMMAAVRGQCQGSWQIVSITTGGILTLAQQAITSPGRMAGRPACWAQHLTERSM